MFSFKQHFQITIPPKKCSIFPVKLGNMVGRPRCFFFFADARARALVCSSILQLVENLFSFRNPDGLLSQLNKLEPLINRLFYNNIESWENFFDRIEFLYLLRYYCRYLLSFIQKDRQSESLVEKLCHRFRATKYVKYSMPQSSFQVTAESNCAIAITTLKPCSHSTLIMIDWR